MPDILESALRELKRHKWQTVAGVAGYFLACGFMVAMVLMLRHDLQAKNATVNYMGNKFLAYAPMTIADPASSPDIRPLDPLNEGFFAEPNVSTSLLPLAMAAQIARIVEVDAVTPFLLYRLKNSQDGHIFSVGGVKPADRHALRGTLINPDDVINGVFFRSEDRNVVLVDKSYADLWNLKVGSVVNIGGTLFPVIGVLSSQARVTRADVYMNWPDAEAALSRRLTGPVRDLANIFLVETSGAETTASAMQKVQQLMQQGLTRSVICSLPAVKFLGLSQNTLKLVLLLLAVLVLLISMNSQWSSVAARRHEIAILKAIGWKTPVIFGQIVAESFLVASAGGLSGALAGFGVFRLLVWQLGATFNAAYLAINAPLVILIIMLLTVLAGVAAALLPAWRAATTRPADVLRSSC
ncbi:MAG TPA: ABC transporter permease [Candidatus Rifleibacterium sp.]|nr:ABC transporter permease [Candidatus Rifleibacterium sp.]